MNFYLIGVDYRSAPPEIRQKFYRKRREIESFWSGIIGLDTAMLVTCNRFDINITAREEKEIIASLELFRKEFPEFYLHSYFKNNAGEVFSYGLSLACGLESQLKGEYQILEQLKVWLKNERFPKSLFEFWSKVIETADEIRQKSGLSSNSINIAKLFFEDLSSLNLSNANLEVAVVGTGKVARLLVEEKPRNISFSFISHKNRLRAEVLANQVNAKVVSFNQLKDVISNSDVLVGATSSPHIILKSGDIPESVLQRDKPLYIYDLGFPMNVAKELGDRKNIILRNLDDLVLSRKNSNNYFQSNLNLAKYLIEEASKANEYIESWHTAKSVSY